jgi:hypothetical protein
MRQIIKFPFRALVYLFVLVIMMPIEYPLWRAYKKEGFEVWNYWKFLWIRTFGTIEQNDYKKV